MKIGLRLGRVYTSLGRPDEALAAYQSINATAKDMQPALTMQRHLKQAEDTLRNGQSGSMVIYALNEAERGLGARVDRPRKWTLMRGEAHLRMGNVNALGEAQNIAMSLLRNNNQDPEALVLRGRALYSQGENEKAIQHFRQALSCDPDFKDAVKYLRMVQKLERTKEEGNAAFKGGRFQEAIDTYIKALEIDPSNKGTNSKILQNRALCYTRLKKWTLAIADCDKALELDPSYTKARKTRAKALGESGNWEEAARELKAIQEANPSEPNIAKDIRNAELELKKSKRKDYYKILGIQKDATDTEIKKAYRKLAIVHHPDKNPDDADAADRFKEIQEAHETLSDPQKRARYDSGEDLMEPEMGGGFPGGGGMGGIDPEICKSTIIFLNQTALTDSDANVRRRYGRWNGRRPRRWRWFLVRFRGRRRRIRWHGGHAWGRRQGGPAVPRRLSLLRNDGILSKKACLPLLAYAIECRVWSSLEHDEHVFGKHLRYLALDITDSASSVSDDVYGQTYEGSSGHSSSSRWETAFTTLTFLSCLLSALPASDRFSRYRLWPSTDGAHDRRNNSIIELMTFI